MLFFYPPDVVCYDDVAGWVAGWVSVRQTVARPYCIKTAKPILSYLTRISRSRHFLKSNIVKTARLKDKVTIAQDEKYLTYGTVLCLVTLTDNVTQRDPECHQNLVFSLGLCFVFICAFRFVYLSPFFYVSLSSLDSSPLQFLALA